MQNFLKIPKLFKEREKISNKLFELGNHHVIPDDLMTRIDKFNADLAEVEKCPDWNAILDVQASERGSWVYGGLGFEFT